MRKVLVLGSTGSIGTQALDVIRANPDRFELVGLSAFSNAELLASQGEEFGLSASSCALGAEAAAALVLDSNADVVVNGITGSAGLKATINTLTSGKTLA